MPWLTAFTTTTWLDEEVPSLSPPPGELLFWADRINIHCTLEEYTEGKEARLELEFMKSVVAVSWKGRRIRLSTVSPAGVRKQPRG